MSASLLLSQSHLMPEVAWPWQSRGQYLPQPTRTEEEPADFRQRQTGDELNVSIPPSVLEFTPLILPVQHRVVLKGLRDFSDSVREIILNEAQGLSLKFRNKIEELYALPANWDGEGAAAIRHDILARAVHFTKLLKRELDEFEEPFLAPTFSGSVQLDWNAERSLEVEFTDPTLSIVGTQIRSGKRDYFSVEVSGDDFETLLSCYRWFSRNELLWPTASA